MLRRTIATRISSFSLFMKDTRHHPKLKGLAIPARGRMMGKLYRALTPQKLQELKKRAAKVKAAKRSPRRPSRYPRVLHKYNKFVKANWNTVTGTACQRMKALAAKWKSGKK
jgi:hypothetical protein